MRLAYPELVDFEILPVGISQQAANDAAVSVAGKYSQQLEISHGEGGIVGSKVRCDECVILLIPHVSDFDFHDLVVERCQVSFSYSDQTQPPGSGSGYSPTRIKPSDS